MYAMWFIKWEFTYSGGEKSYVIYNKVYAIDLCNIEVQLMHKKECLGLSRKHFILKSIYIYILSSYVIWRCYCVYYKIKKKTYIT